MNSPTDKQDPVADGAGERMMGAVMSVASTVMRDGVDPWECMNQEMSRFNPQDLDGFEERLGHALGRYAGLKIADGRQVEQMTLRMARALAAIDNKAASTSAGRALFQALEDRGWGWGATGTKGSIRTTTEDVIGHLQACTTRAGVDQTIAPFLMGVINAMFAEPAAGLDDGHAAGRGGTDTKLVEAGTSDPKNSESDGFQAKLGSARKRAGTGAGAPSAGIKPPSVPVPSSSPHRRLP